MIDVGRLIQAINSDVGSVLSVLSVCSFSEQNILFDEFLRCVASRAVDDRQIFHSFVKAVRNDELICETLIARIYVFLFDKETSPHLSNWFLTATRVCFAPLIRCGTLSRSFLRSLLLSTLRWTIETESSIHTFSLSSNLLSLILHNVGPEAREDLAGSVVHEVCSMPLHCLSCVLDSLVSMDLTLSVIEPLQRHLESVFPLIVQDDQITAAILRCIAHSVTLNSETAWQGCAVRCMVAGIGCSTASPSFLQNLICLCSSNFAFANTVAQCCNDSVSQLGTDISKVGQLCGILLVCSHHDMCAASSLRYIVSIVSNYGIDPWLYACKTLRVFSQSQVAEELFCYLLEDVGSCGSCDWQSRCRVFVASTLDAFPQHARAFGECLLDHVVADICDASFSPLFSPVCLLLDLLRSCQLLADVHELILKRLIEVLPMCHADAFFAVFGCLAVLCVQSRAFVRGVISGLLEMHRSRSLIAVVRSSAVMRAMMMSRFPIDDQDIAEMLEILMHPGIRLPPVPIISSAAIYDTCSFLDRRLSTIVSKVPLDITSVILPLVCRFVRLIDRPLKYQELPTFDMSLPDVWCAFHVASSSFQDSFTSELWKRCIASLTERGFMIWVSSLSPNEVIFRYIFLCFTTLSSALNRVADDNVNSMLQAWYVLGRCISLYRADFESLLPSTFPTIHLSTLSRLMAYCPFADLVGPYQRPLLPNPRPICLTAVHFAITLAHPLLVDPHLLDVNVVNVFFDSYMLSCRWWWTDPSARLSVPKVLEEVASNMNPYFGRQFFVNADADFWRYRTYLLQSIRHFLRRRLFNPDTLSAHSSAFVKGRLSAQSTSPLSSIGWGPILLFFSLALLQELSSLAPVSVSNATLLIIRDLLSFHTSEDDVEWRQRAISVVLSCLPCLPESRTATLRRLLAIIVTYGHPETVVELSSTWLSPSVGGVGFNPSDSQRQKLLPDLVCAMLRRLLNDLRSVRKPHMRVPSVLLRLCACAFQPKALSISCETTASLHRLLPALLKCLRRVWIVMRSVATVEINLLVLASLMFQGTFALLLHLSSSDDHTSLPLMFDVMKLGSQMFRWLSTRLQADLDDVYGDLQILHEKLLEQIGTIQSVETDAFENSDAARPTAHARRRLRSRNVYVDEFLDEEDGTDAFRDLEDFIVCD